MTNPWITDAELAKIRDRHQDIEQEQLEDSNQCARCGAPIRRDPVDPNNVAMRVCNDCAIDLGEEIDQ